MMSLGLVLAFAPVLMCATSAQEDSHVVRAVWSCEPRVVAVGEPFTLALELVYAPEANVFDLGGEQLGLDESWVVFEHARESPVSVTDPQGGADRRLARRVWRVASLEPGRRSLGETLSALVADPRVSSVDASGAAVEVRGLLGPEEDAPRPLKGLPEGFGSWTDPQGSRLRWIVGGLALALWAGVVFHFVLRRRRARPAPAAIDGRERLRGLHGQVDEQTLEPGALHAELTRILREETDRRQARTRDGLTDGEWLADVRALGVPVALAEELEQVFKRAEEVKYAGSLPSSWAVTETFGHAERALEHAVVLGAEEVRA